MTSVDDRVDKRVAIIMIAVIFICAIVIYGMYDYNYGTINTIIGSNHKSQRRIIEMIGGIATTQRKRLHPKQLVVPKEEVNESADNWKLLDDSVFNVEKDPNRLTDEYYNTPQDRYAIDGDISYSSL